MSERTLSRLLETLRGVPSESPKVGVVLLNWNGWQDTIQCLESLDQIYYLNTDVVVVDNNSADDSVSRLVSWCQRVKLPLREAVVPRGYRGAAAVPAWGETARSGTIRRLTLLRLEENAGFCEGNNIGLAQAAADGSDFLLVLNNDTLVASDFLEPMVEAALSDRSVGLIGGVICYAERPEIIWFAGGDFDRYLEATRRLDGATIADAKLPEVIESDWISGCMMMISVDVYREIGGFDERFFIWSEEWDYSLRVRKSGRRLVVSGRSRIYHKVGRSLGVLKPLAYYYGTRNRLLLKRMHLSRRYRLAFMLGFLPSRIVRFTQLALDGRWDLVRAGCAAIVDYFAGRTGKWRAQVG